MSITQRIIKQQYLTSRLPGSQDCCLTSHHIVPAEYNSHLKADIVYSAGPSQSPTAATRPGLMSACIYCLSKRTYLWHMLSGQCFSLRTILFVQRMKCVGTLRLAPQLLQSRHVLARLRPDMYFKMSKCQNVSDSEVGDPKLATRKGTKIGEVVDYRRWGSAVITPPLSYSSVAHFLPSD
jgi:hypothetical protein